jgi:sulfur relay protein TusB/DsrH
MKGVQLSRLCLLIMKPPYNDDDTDRMCGLLSSAKGRGWDVVIYLLGDGVYCAKKGQRGYLGNSMMTALGKGAEINANLKDMLARAIPPENVMPGVKVLEDLEGAFIEDVMEKASRVVSW